MLNAYVVGHGGDEHAVRRDPLQLGLRRVLVLLILLAASIQTGPDKVERSAAIVVEQLVVALQDVLDEYDGD